LVCNLRSVLVQSEQEVTHELAFPTLPRHTLVA